MLKNFKSVSLLLLVGLLNWGGYSYVSAETAAGTSISQQSGKVTGSVKDALGPVPGANVSVKGTTIGTITDMDGKFSLDGVKRGDVIQISYIGYVTQQIQWDGQALNVTLVEDSQKLDEVVVLGYGVAQKKQDLSAAVGVVADAEKLSMRPVTSTACR